MALAQEGDYFQIRHHYEPILYATAYSILNDGIERASAGQDIKLLVSFMDRETQEVRHESVYDLSTPWTKAHKDQIAFWMRRAHRVSVLEAREHEAVRRQQAG